MLSAGMPVKVFCETFYHHGIADGTGFVFHCSKEKQMVVREPEYIFADGRNIIQSDIPAQNPEEAINKAWTYLGLPYSLFSFNCEHFVRSCHGLEIESPQIQKYIIASTGIVVAGKSNNGYIKIAGLSAAIVSLLTPTDESPIPNILAAIAIIGGIALCAG